METTGGGGENPQFLNLTLPKANVYNCECWSQEGIYFTVPFFQRAEVGVRAYARSVQVCFPHSLFFL